MLRHPRSRPCCCWSFRNHFPSASISNPCLSYTPTAKPSSTSPPLNLRPPHPVNMRTRRGNCYSKLKTMSCNNSRRRAAEELLPPRKRRRINIPDRSTDYFDTLPDDLVISILSKLSSSAASPSDFVSVLITCKRLHGLGHHSLVLSKASQKTFAVKAKNWTVSAHRFFKLCADAGNVDASYTLGMIRFYCLENRGSGASLMAKAAIGSHAPALYSLAVIQFNGSGGSKNDKDLRAGVALCARAAFLGHVDAIRELGHCLQDGYGVRQNISEGRRFLVQANARELATVLSSPLALSKAARSLLTWNQNQPQPQSHKLHLASGCPLLSDFGCSVPAQEPHPASRFLAEWFAVRGGVPGNGGLRMCSHEGCGRPETRKHEFRRCSVCGAVNYCSRACQALDWKLRHKGECVSTERWIDDNGGHGNGNDDVVQEGYENLQEDEFMAE